MMKRPGFGVVALITSLGIILLGAGYFAYEGLTVGEGSVPNDFYIAMTLGIVFSLIVGVGLMGLVFYSSRKGYDEPPASENRHRLVLLGRGPGNGECWITVPLPPPVSSDNKFSAHSNSGLFLMIARIAVSRALQGTAGVDPAPPAKVKKQHRWKERRKQR